MSANLKKSFFLFAIPAAFISLFILLDFFQIGRKPPELAPVELRATRVEIDKTARQLKLLRGAETVAVYNVSLGFSPVGHKSREGDGRTPEGTYSVESKNERSRFHLALRVSYPNVDDRKIAHQLGVSPGGDIMIHGLPNGLSWLSYFHLKQDWTDGCVAVTNTEMNEIWRLVPTGTPIEIRP